MEDKRALKDEEMEQVIGGIQIPTPIRFLNIDVGLEPKLPRTDAADKVKRTLFDSLFRR